MAVKVIMGDADMRRAITRIAHEIVENTRGTHDLVLVGMYTRGVPLARRIAETVKGFEGEPVPVGALDISLYRDDLPKLGARPRLQRSEIPIDITDKRVVLVDDVLYTGRTARAALDALTDFGRPQRILLAVLVDRGHRELPIRPDFVGRNLPTSRGEQIRVQVAETDGVDQVLLVGGE
jgi:pyrimidine operon attenuation protein/uracil phosphoribosyltransferase